MFLLERLFGIGVFAYFLALALLLICRTSIKLRQILIFYGGALTVMGFFYLPYVSADLYRIREMAQEFATYHFQDFLLLHGGSSTLLARIFYWAVGKTGVLGLIPAVAAALTYSCLFYILLRSADIFRLERSAVACILLFEMATGNYMMVISNIRTMIAIAFIGLCFFRETVEKKWRLWHLILYGLAAALHNFAIVLIAMRMVVAVFGSGGSMLRRLGLSLLIAAVPAFLILTGNPLVDRLLDKAEFYLDSESFSYIWEYLTGAMTLAAQALVLLFFRKYCRESVPKLYDSWLFTGMSILCAAVLCFSFTIFHRLATFAAPVWIMPVMAKTLAQDNPAPRGAKNWNRYALLGLSALSLVLNLLRGSLCSLKFFEL